MVPRLELNLGGYRLTLNFALILAFVFAEIMTFVWTSKLSQDSSGADYISTIILCLCIQFLME
jgi:hypothetical protein